MEVIEVELTDSESGALAKSADHVRGGDGEPVAGRCRSLGIPPVGIGPLPVFTRNHLRTS